MKIIALTGSIGTGKSTVLKMFKSLGIQSWDADVSVHNLYKINGRAYDIIGREFGKELLEEDGINRQKLGAIVLNNPKAMKKLEDIIHPLVAADRQEFIQESAKTNPPYVLIDIPLLFETNAQNEFEKIIVVACDFDTQKARVLQRPNMTEEKFKAIVEKQIPTMEKIKLADFVIDTGIEIDKTMAQVEQIDKLLKSNI